MLPSKLATYLILVELIRGGRNSGGVRQLCRLNGHHSIAGRIVRVQVRRSVHIGRLQAAEGERDGWERDTEQNGQLVKYEPAATCTRKEKMKRRKIKSNRKHGRTQSHFSSIQQHITTQLESICISLNDFI